jgi:hypothetical protein
MPHIIYLKINIQTLMSTYSIILPLWARGILRLILTSIR